MLRHLPLALLLLAATVSCGSGSKSTTSTTTNSMQSSSMMMKNAKTSSKLEEYPTEQGAQSHCPRDTVVWLNTKTGVWHTKGSTYYAHTKSGAFVCEKEAAAAGDRPSKNGM